MGIRGELFSTRFACDGRTYFFNVKQNRNGDVFLSIVESKPSEGESFDRRSIVVFGEHMDGFLKSFQTALKYIDKTGTKVRPSDGAYESGPNEAEDRRGRRQDEGRPPRFRREYDGPRESRASSFRENESFAPRQGRRAAPKDGSFSPRPESPRGERPAFAGKKNFERARKKTEGEGRAASYDRPVKRIVVRRAKKQDKPD